MMLFPIASEYDIVGIKMVAIKIWIDGAFLQLRLRPRVLRQSVLHSRGCHHSFLVIYHSYHFIAMRIQADDNSHNSCSPSAVSHSRHYCIPLRQTKKAQAEERLVEISDRIMHDYDSVT